MNNKKNTFSKMLLCIGFLLAIGSIFCFFDTALTMSAEIEPGIVCTATLGPIFVFIFGGNVTMTSTFPGDEPIPIPVKMVPMLTTAFILVIIAIAVVLIVAIGSIAKKINSNEMKTLICLASALILAGAILAILSKNAMLNVLTPLEEQDRQLYKLGKGIIIFSAIGFASVAFNVLGVILHRQPKSTK